MTTHSLQCPNSQELTIFHSKAMSPATSLSTQKALCRISHHLQWRMIRKTFIPVHLRCRKTYQGKGKRVYLLIWSAARVKKNVAWDLMLLCFWHKFSNFSFQNDFAVIRWVQNAAWVLDKKRVTATVERLHWCCAATIWWYLALCIMLLYEDRTRRAGNACNYYI